MITNYHTHTRWCRHGTGEIDDYIQEGIARGLKELAITEHVPLSGDPDPRRLFCGEFDAFNRALDRAAVEYAGRIEVRKGFECEYYPEQLDNYRRYRDRYGYEILILGHHTSCDGALDNFALTEPWQVRRYADEVCDALETGLFTFIAHPDVALHGYRRFDDTFQKAMAQIFASCERLDIPVEINVNGHHYNRQYPCEAVWRTIAPRYRLKGLIGSDAHAVNDLVVPASVAACEALADAAGLRLITSLPVSR